MFQWLAGVVVGRGWVLVCGWLVLTAVLVWVAPSWEEVSRDDDVRFFPTGSISVVGQDLLERGFPQDASGCALVVVGERRNGRLTPADFDYLDRQLIGVLARARQSDERLGIKRVDNHATPVIGSKLIDVGSDEGGQAALTVVSLRGTYVSRATRASVDRIRGWLATLPPPPEGLSLGLTGSAMVGHDINDATARSFSRSTQTTVALVVGILLVVYRSPLLTLIPLVTIAFSAVGSFKSVALLTLVPGLNFQVMNITHIFVIVGLFGAVTDFCLFLIARYREELARGLLRPDALREAIAQVGGALVASAGTVMVGMGTLWFSSFAKIQHTGPALAWSLAVALAASLTLAPVLVHWLRGAVFWPFPQPRAAAAEAHRDDVPSSRFWVATADLVVRRPALILGVCVLGMAPLAAVGVRTRPHFSLLADLSPDQPSVAGAEVVRRHFNIGELSPTMVLLEAPSLDFRSDAGKQAVDELTRRLASVSGVAEVRSVTRPLGGRPTPAGPGRLKSALRSDGPLSGVAAFPRVARLYWGVLAALDLYDEVRALATRAVVDPRYVSFRPANPRDRDHVTRLDVVFEDDPFTDDALAALEEVRSALQEMTGTGHPLDRVTAFGMSGATAMVADLKRATNADKQRMYVLVPLGIYAILVVLLRRPGTCLYLIATVIFGYYTSLGLTALFFQALHAGPEPWVGLDWKVFLFLFVILVAVGEDYNIFLMTRVGEEAKKHGLTEGTRRAVAQTGGIISSCGLIVAGTYASLLTASLTTLRELGFALSVGVLLDTFLVRPILVPAFLALIDRRPAPRGLVGVVSGTRSARECDDEPEGR